MTEQPEQKFYTSKELIEIFPEAIAYLEENKRLYDSWILMLNNTIIKQYKVAQKSSDPEFWEKVVDVLTYAKKLEETEKELKKIEMYLHKPIEGEITQADIERAKEFPFDQLIQANKIGFAFCPKHEEKTASFYIKKNYGYCFSCNYSCDTIQFLIDTQDYTFKEAVKRLN